MAAVNFIYRSYKYSAKKRKLDFNLTLDTFIKFIYESCFYCGSSPQTISLTLNSNANCAPKDIAYNGIDRVNSNVGYIADNCVTCCRVCNRAKSDMSSEDFILWMNKLINFRSEHVSA